jgi:hypothetical protein
MGNALDRRREIMSVILTSVKKATLVGLKIDKEKLINEIQRAYGSDRRKALEYIDVYIKSGVFIDSMEGLFYHEQEQLDDIFDFNKTKN